MISGPGLLATGARAAILCALLPSAATLGAQQDFPRQPQLFLERSYFAPLSPLGEGYVFEGEAAIHLFYHNRLDKQWTATGGWKRVVSLSYLPLVRMMDVASSPVRTPSYRIRPFYLQLFHAPRQDTARGSFRLSAYSIGYTHYSNGQDGCLHEGFVRNTATDRCEVADAALASQRRVNTRDGDFSTTYIPVRFDLRRGTLDPATFRVRAQHSVGVEVQIHPIGMRIGGISRELATAYGQHQVNAWYEYEFASRLKTDGFTRVSLMGKYRMPSAGGSDWWTATTEIAHTWDNLEGFGAFGRIRVGYDDYNIRFRERAQPSLTVGATWDARTIRYFNRR
ncbi:MAG: hypothetical protein WC700_09920 [Gemmatimonadaceae bacterium]|jgi:hypothetical protein